MRYSQLHYILPQLATSYCTLVAVFLHLHTMHTIHSSFNNFAGVPLIIAMIDTLTM